jgi:hypothetical protein
MTRSLFDTRFHQVLGCLTLGGRPQQCRPRARRFFEVESLEKRALLANITPSATINSAPSGSDYNYTITLNNSSSSTSGIGTFWYAWIPGEDFLATKPISITPPSGWSDTITHGGSTDGYAIQYTANSSTDYVQPGHSLSFLFKSADTPKEVNGNSNFYPGTPVGTSFVYPMEPFSDSGHEFVVAPALLSIAVTPANPKVPKGLTQQLTATGTYDGGSTKNITTQVTWASSNTAVATISNTSGSRGLATAVATGTSTISAKLNGITGSTVLTVTAAVLEKIAVTPANPSIAKGKTQQFTATGTYSDKTTKNLTTQVNWASSNTAVATISNTSGTRGLATAVGIGSTTISATFSGVKGTTVLTVTSSSAESITFTTLVGGFNGIDAVANLETSNTASSQWMDPAGRTAPAIPLPVKYVVDSIRYDVRSPRSTGQSSNLTDRAVGEVATSHRLWHIESLVERIARARVSVSSRYAKQHRPRR